MQYPLHQTIAPPPFHAEIFPENWGQEFPMYTRFIWQISSWKRMLLHCPLHTSCHVTLNNILWNSAAKNSLETCIHPNASWEYRMVHLKMLLPFFRIFTKLKDIPYYMRNSSSTASVKMEESFSMSDPDWFSSVTADGAKTSPPPSALCAQAVTSTSSDLLQMWSKVTF